MNNKIEVESYLSISDRPGGFSEEEQPEWMPTLENPVARRRKNKMEIKVGIKAVSPGIKTVSLGIKAVFLGIKAVSLGIKAVSLRNRLSKVFP